MKKIFIACSAIFLLSIGAKAQYKIEDLSINYGEEITEDKGKIVKIIGETKSKIFALGLKGKKNYFLKVFEVNSMKMLSNNPIEIPEDGKEMDFEDVVMLNNKIYLLASVYNRKEKTFTLDAFEFTENGMLKPKMYKLFESVVERSSLKGSFYFKSNNSNNKLLIMHTALFDKEDAMKFELKLVDDNMNVLCFKEDKVSYDESNFKDYQFLISDFDVDNNDNIFMVINEGYRDKSKKEKVENFFLYGFKKINQYKKETTKINVIDKEIINCNMLITNQDEIKLVGFYSGVSASGRADRELKGLYNASVSINNLATKDIKFNEFDYATKVKILGERKAKGGKELNPIYEIQSIIEKNDGGIIVLSEYSTVFVGRTTGFGPLSSTPITYDKKEIIVNSLKKDGTLEWSNVVGKEQRAVVSSVSFNIGAFGATSAFAVAANLSISLGTMGSGREYISAIPIYSNGELSILFNDHRKNKGVTSLDDIKSISNFSNGMPTLYRFDSNGNVVRKDPEDALRNELIIRPGVFYRKTDKEYILFISNEKKDKLARLFI